MEKAAVIADAGPLISVACSDGLAWLHGLLPDIALTPAVAAEVLVAGKPGVARIEQAFKDGWLRVLSEEPRDLPVLDKYNLDSGERGSIAAAYSIGPECLLIVDEPRARNAARELGVRFVGTAGLLVEAKNAALIASCAQELDKLIEIGFFVSREIVEAVLNRAGESLADAPSLLKRFGGA